MSRAEEELDIEPGLACRSCGAGVRLANPFWADCINPYCEEGEPLGH